MVTTPLAALGLGFALGMRHALDADHVAAVSTIVSARRSLLGSSLVGALWGFGHTLALVVVAVLVVALRTSVPPHVAHALELAVAVMLVTLGVNLLRTLWQGGLLHLHAHAHHLTRVGGRPLLVGALHGLAGSGALTLAVAASVPSPARALAYVGVFGLGSVVGMMLMSILLSLPLLLAARRFAGAERLLAAGAAVGSVAVGVLLAWETSLEAGLLL
jgi:high-affinity nickel-transport protein